MEARREGEKTRRDGRMEGRKKGGKKEGRNKGIKEWGVYGMKE